MIYGIVGAGLMGGGLARCLASKGHSVLVFNRTRRRAEDLCRSVGCRVVDTPADLSEADVVIVFVFDDRAVEDVFLGRHGLSELGRSIPVVNASTITPETSIRVARAVEEMGIPYFEGPVYGSVDEAAGCRLLTLLAGREPGIVRGFVEEYSTSIIYVGEVPKAMALKLALNNIGLALPPIIGESLAILEAYDVSLDVFREAVGKLWFGGPVNRYLDRITGRGRTRFTVRGAAKDYYLVSSTLYGAGYPAMVSSSLMNFYLAAIERFGGEDYPRAARWILRKEKTSG